MTSQSLGRLLLWLKKMLRSLDTDEMNVGESIHQLPVREQTIPLSEKMVHLYRTYSVVFHLPPSEHVISSMRCNEGLDIPWSHPSATHPLISNASHIITVAF